MRWTGALVALVAIGATGCTRGSAGDLAALDARCAAAWTAHDDAGVLSACRAAAHERRSAAERATSADEREQHLHAESLAERTLLRETFRLPSSAARGAQGAEARTLDRQTRAEVTRDVLVAGDELALGVATDLAKTAAEATVRAYAAERRVEIQRDLLNLDPTWTPPT